MFSPENTSLLSFAPHGVNIVDELLNNNNRSHARVSVRLWDTLRCAASFGSNCSHNLSTHFGWSVQLTVSMLTSANLHKYAKHKANF